MHEVIQKINDLYNTLKIKVGEVERQAQFVSGEKKKAESLVVAADSKLKAAESKEALIAKYENIEQLERSLNSKIAEASTEKTRASDKVLTLEKKLSEHKKKEDELEALKKMYVGKDKRLDEATKQLEIDKKNLRAKILEELKG